MKKITLLIIIFILNISLFSCKEEHVHNFKVDGLCECGEVARVKVIKQVNESSEEIIVKYNETVKKIEDPVIEGLSFVGWYVDEVLFDFTKPITSQVTIYAKFKEIYQVKFLDYDGTVLDTQFVLEGCDALPLEDPTGVYKSGDGSVSGGSNTTGSGHFGKFLFSDTVKWVKEEWIDYILPQCYASFNNPNYSFQDITTWWNKDLKQHI